MRSAPSREGQRRPGRAVLAALILVAAACSGDSGVTAGDATTSSTTSSPASSTTAPATTAPATTAPATTAAAGEPAPLTGRPGPRLDRPALVVKIDNHPEARPQAGLGVADIVYEEIVEGITRFFAVFHSTDAAPVGPIRSARTTDVDLLAMLSTPLFAWSGGNDGVVAAIRRADATDVGASRHPEYGYVRDPSRRSPHNLFSTTEALRAGTPAGQGDPAAVFTYRPGPLRGGTPVAGVRIRMRGTSVRWSWDAAAGVWVRTQDGTPHLDDSGRAVRAENVVVQVTRYRPSPADVRSPEAVTVGTGDAWLFLDGRWIEGTWERPSPAAATVFRDGSGTEVGLTPGRTWVELAEAGTATVDR